jgi:hypothetical protein
VIHVYNALFVVARGVVLVKWFTRVNGMECAFSLCESVCWNIQHSCVSHFIEVLLLPIFSVTPKALLVVEHTS